MTLLTPGETCWRRESADRVAFLIDTEAYFAALHEAVQHARRSILILGWGFDPRARLFPDGHDGPDDPDEIGHVLLRIAAERPELDVRLLIWKSALPISASQDFFPHKARKWFEGSQVHFHLDDMVPLGACHHQKAVIIDDRVAFCGGGDISIDRWDSPNHLHEDARRIMPDQDHHAPRHEVMAMVDGSAAKALAEHFRERWRVATDETLQPPEDAGGDPWPDFVPPQLFHANIGIGRTSPAWRDHAPADEIRRLTLASIAAAKDVIYLENQYFTSPVLTEAVAKRLAEPNGPEVVLITTGEAPSWFDKMTMDSARRAMVWRLHSADIFGRFRALWPSTSGGTTIIVHSKVTVVDNTLVRIGSANLNNRSMGFDTELELAIECEDEEARRAAEAFRDRSVGHFMGYTGDAVAKARADHGGLVAAIDALNRDGRLVKIDPRPQGKLAEFISTYHVGDPCDTWDAFHLGRRRRRLLRQARIAARS